MNRRFGIATILLLLGALATLPLCVLLYVSHGWQVRELRDDARAVQEQQAGAAARGIAWRLQAMASHIRFVDQLEKLNGGALTLPKGDAAELALPGGPAVSGAEPLRLSPIVREGNEAVAYLSVASGPQGMTTRRVPLRALLADRPTDAPRLSLVDAKGTSVDGAGAIAAAPADLRDRAAVAPVLAGWTVAVAPDSAALTARESSLKRRYLLGGLAALAIGLALVHLVALRLRSAMDDVISEFGDEEGTGPDSSISELAQIGGALASARAKFGQTASELERARHDALTGLPGRELFLQQAAAQVAAAQAMDDYAVAILYLDLDGFKAVNDSQGHRAGDEILRRVAATLRQHVRAPDTVGRMGGDEFVVCVSAPRRHLMEVATRAVDRIGKGVAALGGGVGCSIGWATASCERNLTDLIHEADAAMYVNKLARRHENRTAALSAG